MEHTFFQSNRFAVLSCTPGKVCGILFCRDSGIWKIGRFVCREQQTPLEQYGKTLKELQKELGCSGKEKLYIAGELQGSCFLRHNSVELPFREQSAALELVLPELLPVPMEYPRIQFFEKKSEENPEVEIQLCVFPGAEAEKLCADLAENGFKADEFIDPLLLLNDDDPAFFMDDLHPGYCFQQGCWRSAPGESAKEEALKQWQTLASQWMTLPENFKAADFQMLLPVARLEMSHHPVSSFASLRLLPEKLRPLRYRHQLELTGILVFLLIVCSMWGNIREWSDQYSRYSEVMEQCQKGRARISSINNKLKRNAKLEREMSRIVSLQAGEEDFLVKLAAFSRILPDNVQLVNLRTGDGAWDLMLQSENNTLNLPALINPLGYWKIAQLQQRQMWNSDVTTINLRLVPNEPEEKAEASKRSGKKGKSAK